MTNLASKGQLRASLLRWTLITIPACVLLGLLSGQFGSADSQWFQLLEKPDIFPPPVTFGIVWTILYIVMGFALAMVSAAWGARGRTMAIVLFIIQFLVNLSWTPVFFGAYQITGGLYVLGALTVLLIATIHAFWKVRPTAALLLVPYLAWVLFASVLNYQFLQLNPDKDGVEPGSAVERIEF